MWEISEIKARGRAAFKANYWPCVIVALLLSLLVGGGLATGGRNVTVNMNPQEAELEMSASDQREFESGMSELTEAINGLTAQQKNSLAALTIGAVSIAGLVGLALKIFVFNPLMVGCHRFYRNNVLDPRTGIGAIGEGFGNYGHTFITLLVRDVFTFLWTLLFFIPGVIKSYSYMLVPYIVKDEPGLSATGAIARSRDLMRGSKGRAFLMDLSFIGWFLLGVITFNLVNVFWTIPYYYSAKAALYLELSGVGNRAGGSHFRR